MKSKIHRICYFEHLHVQKTLLLSPINRNQSRLKWTQLCVGSFSSNGDTQCNCSTFVHWFSFYNVPFGILERFWCTYTGLPLPILLYVLSLRSILIYNLKTPSILKMYVYQSYSLCKLNWNRFLAVLIQKNDSSWSD